MMAIFYFYIPAGSGSGAKLSGSAILLEIGRIVNVVILIQLKLKLVLGESGLSQAQERNQSRADEPCKYFNLGSGCNLVTFNGF